MRSPLSVSAEAAAAIAHGIAGFLPRFETDFGKQTLPPSVVARHIHHLRITLVHDASATADACRAERENAARLNSRLRACTDSQYACREAAFAASGWSVTTQTHFTESSALTPQYCAVAHRKCSDPVNRCTRAAGVMPAHYLYSLCINAGVSH